MKKLLSFFLLLPVFSFSQFTDSIMAVGSISNQVMRKVTDTTRTILMNGDTSLFIETNTDRLFTVSYTSKSVLQVVRPKIQTPTIPPAPPPLTPPVTSYGTLVYQNGYDNSDDINANQLGRGSISTAQVLSGTGSFRSEVRGSDPQISSGYRSEQEYSTRYYPQANPAEGVYEYDVYYENWKAVSGGGHSIQWHPESSSGGAVLSLQNYGGKFNVVRSLGGTNYHQSASTQITTQPNKWYKMRWEIKWSTGSDGYIRLYIDNALYYSFNGRTSDGGQYLKLGQNRWNMSSSQNTIVYYDNLRIYKK